MTYDQEYYAKNRDRKRAKWDAWARTVPGQWRTSKNKARLAKQEWTLTLEEYAGLRAMPCYYCGGPLPESSRGLDRIDSSKGYTLENVVPCCGGCNQLKSDRLTKDETLAVVALLKQMRPKGLWI